ncbi:hypothetical protein HNP46_000091 [Pseudomonas nitritireducens]|uniref:Uncharacterized protein n=1 Tax=Pseudomonas nitroreducens TaxID=46680 RepID=A0A7W7KEB2_PSENT|nr:hypothetical protein [Pseudomonas nitritireducens]MBB4861280.1 hypothetical protein [Pseudomonas nitritireducens]
MTDFTAGFIDEQIKNGNLDAARDFVRLILPQVYKRLADLPVEVRLHYSMPDSPVRQDLLNLYGLSSEDAVRFIQDAICDYRTRESLDREYLQLCIRHVGENIHDLTALAAYNVDVEMFELLEPFASKESIEVLVSNETEFKTTRIRGRFKTSEPFRFFSSKDVKKCLTALIAMGCSASAAVGRIGSITNSTNGLVTTNLADTNRLEIQDLPVVAGGVIRNPSLFHAIHSMQGDALYGRLVSHVPCLIKNEDENRFSKKCVLPWQAMIYGVDGLKHHYAPLAAFLSHERNVRGETGVIDTAACFVSIGAMLKSTSYAVEGQHYVAGLEFGYTNQIGSGFLSQILSVNACIGHEAPAGYSIALIDIEELALTCSAEKESKASTIDCERLEQLLCNAKFLALHKDTMGHNKFDLPIIDSTTPIEISSMALSDGSLRSVVDDDFIKAALRKSNKDVPVNVLVYARDNFGMNFDTRDLEFEHSAISELVAAKFKVVPHKHNLKRKNFQNLTNSDRISWLRLGGWYGELPRPESLAEALKKASPRRDDNIYELYLATFPLDELIPKCKTPRLKVILGQVFTPEELEPYVDRLADATLTTTLIETFNL